MENAKSGASYGQFRSEVLSFSQESESMVSIDSSALLENVQQPASVNPEPKGGRFRKTRGMEVDTLRRYY